MNTIIELVINYYLAILRISALDDNCDHLLIKGWLFTIHY